MFRLRPVGSADLQTICHHREAMFRDAGVDEARLKTMTAPFHDWLQPRLEDGRYFGLIAEADDKAIGGIGLMEIDWPPHPMHPTESRRGYILNLFIEPEFRRLGIARALMTAADKEFQHRGISYAVLHATSKGRPLYERTGWSATAEMSKQYFDEAATLSND